MRDDDHGHPLVGEVDHDLEHLVDHLRVERAGRLVEKDEFGLHRQGPGNGDALLLTAGELGRHLFRLVRHPHAFEQRHRALLGLGLRHPAHFDGAQSHVFENRLVREEVEGLEDHAHVGAKVGEGLPLGRQRHTVDRDDAGVDCLEPVDRAAQR